MNVHDDTHIFDQVFRVWVQRTCREWNFDRSAALTREDHDLI